MNNSKKEYNYDYEINNYITPIKINSFNKYLKNVILKINAQTHVNNNKNVFQSVNKTFRESKIPRKKCDYSLEYSTLPDTPNLLHIPSISIFDKHDTCFDNYKTTKEITKINIDVEVNSLSDLLDLIEKYTLCDDTCYNINMKSLHEIKEPLIELNNMVGMKELKINIVEQILYFIQEFNKTDSGDFMHTVIYGPPGTGKTEIAKIIGKIYSNVGVLSKGTFKKVTRSDLVAGYLGQTAIKTKEVIKEAIGGVLFIDEAYSLGNNEKRDSFSKECIDTLCEALSDHKQDLMVIIAGYENELKECFFNYNQGLDSRFVWRFKTDEYTGEDLYNIFVKKVNDINWKIYEAHSTINVNWFEKNAGYFKFYGRDIESLLAKTKIAHSKRVFCKSETEKTLITLEDLDKGFKLYLNNNEAKNHNDANLIRKQIQYSMYN
jgi:SpoVK/Ycf46/Vps4 family AAA+-type ATPase